MGRVKFKHARPKELGTRRNLLAILAPHVKVFELFPVRDGVVARTSSEDDEDVIFQDDMRRKLEEAGFTAVMPPELRSRRTVICFRVDELAYEYDAAEMKEELEKQQDWMKVDEVYKFTGSRTIKIVCASCEVARKALETGILMFYISIPPSQMKKEDNTPLTACNRCQAIEDHPTNTCPHPDDYKACSECSSKEHTFRECTSAIKKCLNCEGAHSARAMRCPVRKRALKEKQARIRREKEEKKNVSYAQATQAPLPPVTQTSFHSPGFMLLIEAHLVDCAAPGTFQGFLSDSLALNGLPDLKVPPRPPSVDIIRAIAGDTIATLAQRNQRRPANPEGGSTNTHTPTQTADAAETNLGHATSPQVADLTDEESTTSEEDEEKNIEEDEEEHHVQLLPDPEILILRKKSDVFPNDYSARTIRSRARDGRYKIVHSGTAEQNPLVEKWFLINQQPFDSYCVAVKDELFARLNNGSLPANITWEQIAGRRLRRQKK